jgi:hypothetical protein
MKCYNCEDGIWKFPPWGRFRKSNKAKQDL